MELEQVLIELGLNKLEAKTYLALLNLGQANIQSIASVAGIKRTSIYNFIERLMDLGLVSKNITGKKTYFIAEPPETLLLLLDQKQQLLDSCISNFQQLYEQKKEIPKFKYFRGSIAVKEMWNSTLGAKEKLIRWVVPVSASVSYVGVPFINKLVIQLVKKGIRTRILRRFGQQGSHKYAAAIYAKQLLREVKQMPPTAAFNFSMIIYDDTVIMIAPIQENFGFLIKSQTFADVMRIFYDNLWNLSSFVTK